MKYPYDNIKKRIEYAESMVDSAGIHGLTPSEQLMAAQAVAMIAQVEILMELDSTLDMLVTAQSKRVT